MAFVKAIVILNDEIIYYIGCTCGALLTNTHASIIVQNDQGFTSVSYNRLGSLYIICDRICEKVPFPHI